MIFFLNLHSHTGKIHILEQQSNNLSCEKIQMQWFSYKKK